MRHCDGRLFDGSACNNDLYECTHCGVIGCHGDGCDNQRFLATRCCGNELGAIGAGRAAIAAA